MKVRPAQIQDAEIIAQINVQTWHEAYKGIIADEILLARTVDEKRIKTWEKIIQSSERIVLVCENNDKVIGYLAAGPARDEYSIKHEIYALYVHPSAQGQGAGSKLIEKYKEIIHFEHFYLNMLKSNQKAAKFYEKNGGKIAENIHHTITIGTQTFEEVCYFFK